FLSYCARLKPTTIEDLELVRGVSKKIISKYGQHIVDIINNVKAMKKTDLVTIDKEVNMPIVDSNIKNLANFFLQIKAKDYEISLKLVTDSTDLTYFLAGEKYPSKLRESWRWDFFGKDLERLKNGELLIGIEGKKVTFIEKEQQVLTFN
ncbi:MAG TPA: hypothetical protein DCL21_02790, partial [Alphaproteobacteria bacterium]|nr:hypothetical protein [Alphaproteobacteria bacterium]